MESNAFNFLLAGPLESDDLLVIVTRLALCLRYVVDTCGDCGEAALVTWCAEQARRDNEVKP